MDKFYDFYNKINKSSNNLNGPDPVDKINLSRQENINLDKGKTVKEVYDELTKNPYR